MTTNKAEDEIEKMTTRKRDESRSRSRSRDETRRDETWGKRRAQTMMMRDKEEGEKMTQRKRDEQE